MNDGLNKIQKMILNTVEVIIKRKLETAGFDRTFSARVIAVLGNNRYKVEMHGSEYAFSFCLDGELKINDTVWITFPQGNSQLAFISGIKR